MISERLIEERRLSTSKEHFTFDGFTFIPAGQFLMGSADDSEAERPVHRVFVSAFWCATSPVTNAEFERFVVETGYQTTAELNGGLRCTREGRRDFFQVSWRDFTDGRSDHPVVGVSWFDAQVYCEWLRQTTGLPFRLPTEAEWEKAARGGLEQSPFPWGDEPAEIVGANFGHVGASEIPRTVPVSLSPRNRYGINIGGNTWEWVNDWFDDNYYKATSYRDPQGPEAGVFKVRRGGAFNNRRSFRLRVASRNRLEPEKTFLNMSFRVVCLSARADSPMMGKASSKISPTGLRLTDCALLRSSTSMKSSASESAFDAAIRKNLREGMSLSERVEAVLDVLRPNMEEDDGGVEVLSVDPVRLRMIGTCHNCPKSGMTFGDIADTLRKYIPAIGRIEKVV